MAKIDGVDTLKMQLLARTAVTIPSKSPIADHSLILVRQDSELAL